MVNFNESAIASYGIEQDAASSIALVEDLGQTLSLQGNAWKRINFDYEITANTVLEFEFKLTSEGEIHGIGFDTDSVQSAADILQLGGTDPWTTEIRPLELAPGAPLVTGQWYKYTVFVGDYFSGPKNYLTFINDQDVANPTAASAFRGLRVYEAVDTQPIAPLDFSVATITSYGRQDRQPQVEVQDAGNTLKLSQNTWKKLDFDYNITEDTVLSFEFKSGSKGEIHGIGFDDNNRLSSKKAFQLDGTQTWGRQDFRNYATSSQGSSGDWKRYEISVGEFFTGDVSYLTLINDHDLSPRNAESFFRDVRVFEQSEAASASPIIDLGDLVGISSVTDGLNAANQSDRYSFSLDQTRDFNVILEDLAADANLSLFDGTGANLIATSANDGNLTEQLSQTLAAGNYQLLVETTNANANTGYDLVFSATADVAGQNRDLEVSTATYLGGNAQDQAAAIEVSPHNELVLAGNFGTAQGAGQSFLGASSSSAGQIVRLSLSGREVLSVTHLGDDINDMDVNRVTGAIAAVGDFGVTVLSPTGDQVYWSQDLGEPVERVAIANNGTVVTLHNKTISVWNPGGHLRARTTLVRSYVNDIAVDPASGNVYVTGFDNKNNVNDSNNPVQVAFLTGLDLDLQTNWQTWGFEGNILTDDVNGRGQNDMADTRGYRVTVGRDGQLYFLGEVAGGNSIYRWNGKDRSTPTQVKYDAYNDPYNSASPHQTYYARIDSDTGEVMQGQLAFPRYNNASNAFRVEDGTIAADEAGNVYIGGVTYSGVDGRDDNAIAGQSVGSYAFQSEGDLTALVVSHDFQQRRLWTPFTDHEGKGKVQGFAVGNGRAALLGTVVEGTTITADALNPHAFNADTHTLSDVYLATWATDTESGFASVQNGTDTADDLTGGSTADLLIGGLGADTLLGDQQQPGGGVAGGADVFAYNSTAEGGDTILDFQAQDYIRVSASGFGLASGSVAVLATDSQSLGSSKGFIYSGGQLYFDGDGAGSQQASLLATLSGVPSISASQIQIQ